MKWTGRSAVAVLVLAWLLALGACSPEVGSDEWCSDMREKPKKDWTASEAADYAKYCVFRFDKK